MKTHTLNADNEQIDLLEALTYEVESRKSLIGFLASESEINQEFYNKIFTEYQDFFIQLESAKKEFEKIIKVNYPNLYSWRVNFYTKTLTITTTEE